ncbi:hypothetical protein HUJ05_005894 [Dendroctonus ponderosae]|nr:hypothetical protein HUJ05_005894 [Dendroctonus ponderosae]
MPLHIFPDFHWFGIAKLPSTVPLARALSENLRFLQILLGAFLQSRFERKMPLRPKEALASGALEIYRAQCEELQLELTSNSRTRVSSSVAGLSSYGSGPQHQSWSQSKGTEIEKIMAKIEQDNRILAELDHSRNTTLGTLASTGVTYVSNPASVGGYNSSPYNSLGQHYSTNKSLMGTTGMNSLGHHQIGLGAGSLGQQSVLGTLMQPISNMTGNVLGGTSLASSGLGTSMVPSNYATSSISNTTFTNPLASTNHSRVLGQSSSYNNPSFNNPISSTLGQYSTLNQYSNQLPIVTSSYSNAVTFSNPLSSQFNSLGATQMSIKLKAMDEVDLGQRRAATPVTPHPPPWCGTLGITDLRPRMLADGLDSDWSGGATVAGLPSGERSYLNGQQIPDGQVDMLDIPGKGRCSVYIARFSYDPEPETEEELSIVAGDYLLVWGEPMGPGGYLDAELLDGRRGLVPAHFVQRLIGDDLLEFHQAVLSTLREEEINQENFAADVARLNELAEMAEQHEDDNTGPEGEAADLLFSVLVPAPRQLTLERQLNKSVLISWTTPENVGPGNQIESYHVYVDGVLKATIKATERTRALVEGVDSNRPHRISVRSVTANRRTSRDAACTMIIGRDTHQLGPSAVRASNITSTSAVISWLPANSNHQHVVCVNNVENVANLAEELPMPAAAHTDFRTLPKGLPDPPSDILVEPGPQDGTLLVTWHPISTPHHPASGITGYAVYADGKKVTDVDSPTGDHALIDISKLLGLNPRHVTVRTKARDSQSADSVPTAIPASVLRGGPIRRQQPHSAVMPAHLRQPMPRNQQQSQGQQIIEPDENLSDKEIFPNSQAHRQQQGGIPSIEITKENYDANMSEDELDSRNRRMMGFNRNQTRQQQNATQPQNVAGTSGPTNQQQYYGAGQAQQVVQNQRQNQMMRSQQQPMRPSPNNPQRKGREQNANPKYFVALFDYDPATMSPNPDACDEELPFSEGDTIKVRRREKVRPTTPPKPITAVAPPTRIPQPIKARFASAGRRGFVPHNMVMELDSNHSNQAIQQHGAPAHGNQPLTNPVRRMVALYDYDPQELSPNVDAEVSIRNSMQWRVGDAILDPSTLPQYSCLQLQVELSFSTGQIITIFGEMDEDGFYNAEIDGVRGLVPSNFLADAPDQFGAAGPHGPITRGGRGGQGQARGAGPGARGPPPPPRETQIRGPTTGAQPRGKVSPLRPVAKTQGRFGHSLKPPQRKWGSENPALSPHPNALFAFKGRLRGMLRPGPGNQTQMQPTQPNQPQQFGPPPSQNTSSSMGGLFSSLTGSSQSQPPYGQANQQNQRIQHKGVPQVVPNVGGMAPSGAQPQQGLPGVPGGPNLMQKLNEITAPGGDILSKGKELIFMKFGLGGK